MRVCLPYGVGIADSARGELDDGMGPHACGNAPRTYVGTSLHDSLLAIEIDKVDRELHAEGMHSLAGNDPEPFACRQAPAEQPLAAVAADAGQLHAVGDLRAASDIDYLQVDIRRIVASSA